MAIIRNTIAKKAVFEIIQLNKTAMSQTEIFAKANNICDRVTVYRILERLVKEMKIHKIVNVNGVINYAPCNSCSHEQHVHHDHLHFSCTTCKKLTCISAKCSSSRVQLLIGGAGDRAAARVRGRVLNAETSGPVHPPR